ncbi:hypothetical protein D3C77_386560 [compost metagenome]
MIKNFAAVFDYHQFQLMLHRLCIKWCNGIRKAYRIKNMAWRFTQLLKALNELIRKPLNRQLLARMKRHHRPYPVCGKRSS